MKTLLPPHSSASQFPFSEATNATSFLCPSKKSMQKQANIYFITFNNILSFCHLLNFRNHLNIWIFHFKKTKTMAYDATVWMNHDPPVSILLRNT